MLTTIKRVKRLINIKSWVFKRPIFTEKAVLKVYLEKIGNTLHIVIVKNFLESKMGKFEDMRIIHKMGCFDYDSIVVFEVQIHFPTIRKAFFAGQFDFYAL